MQELREIISKSLGVRKIHEICRIVESDSEAREQIFDLFADANARVASNAAWVATHLSSEALTSLQMRQNELIKLCMGAADNVTLQRLLLNLLERQMFTFDTLRTDFLDFCFEQMMSASATLGVRSLCVKIAYRLCSTADELMSELAQYTDILMQTELQPGLLGAVMNVRKKMPKHFQNWK